MRVAVLTIGTEILIGQTVDTNSNWIGQQLFKRGIELNKIIAISDTFADIEDTIQTLSQSVDLLLITGGLGPTQDDITKTVVTKLMGVSLVFDANHYEKIVSIFTERNIPLSPLHKQQCYFPQSIRLLDNALGTAPGMLWKYNKCTVINMPGVPYEMQYIMHNHVLPFVDQQHTSNWTSETIHILGLPESYIADKIEHLISSMPPHHEIAYLPSPQLVRVRLSSKDLEGRKTIPKFSQQISEIFGNAVLGYGNITLPEAIKDIALKKSLKLGLAESCTGGLTSHLLTLVPGISQVFEGSVVSYSYHLKNKILHVPSDILTNHGAVSELTVKHMVEGSIRALDVDVAVAISGIAGPGGGTDEKPVGTVWICVGSHDKLVSKKFLFNKNREINIRYSANMALIMLRNFLLEI